MNHENRLGPADLEIRRATDADVTAIRAVALEAWDVAYDAFDRDAIEGIVDDWYDESMLERAFAKPETTFLVADDDGRIVGFCHAVVGDDEGDVLRTYVHPDRWNGGIGTALVDGVVDRCRDEGVATLRAMVLADNEVGSGFYESLGFRQTTTATTDIGDEEYEETVYEQPIRPPAET